MREAKGVDEQEQVAVRRLRAQFAGLRMQVEMVRVMLRLKAGFRPDQPRVPAGNPDGGQWTDEYAPDQFIRVSRRRGGGGQ